MGGMKIFPFCPIKTGADLMGLLICVIFPHACLNSKPGESKDIKCVSVERLRVKNDAQKRQKINRRKKGENYTEECVWPHHGKV